MKGLTAIVEEALTDLASRAKELPSFTPRLEERGTVLQVGDGIASVSGLGRVGFHELVLFSENINGLVFDLTEDRVGVVILDAGMSLEAGDPVRRTGRVIEVPVGEGFLGRMVDPLGRPLDGKGPIPSDEALPIEREAAAIRDRVPVTEPLQTGIKVIDMMIPLGRGQRELIIGDRSIGKSAIAVDTILNQRDQNVLCFYCAIGQKSSAVGNVLRTLQEHGALDYTVVMVADPDSPPGIQYIAPYAACSMAEHLTEQGRDTLVIYDDLTKHAQVYRQISLLLRRPPGREAYPGDIFYIHSRLLERATRFSAERGGGSLTALPVVETQAGNISAYIPTNLISITDGQIYLDSDLFYQGQRPAVDVGRSVSRIGGKTQHPMLKKRSQRMRLLFTQFKELESFTRFGSRIEESSRGVIDQGKRIQELLRQDQFAPLPVEFEFLTVLAGIQEFIRKVPLEEMETFQQRLFEEARKTKGGLLDRIRAGEKLSEEEVEEVRSWMENWLEQTYSKPEGEEEEVAGQEE